MDENIKVKFLGDISKFSPELRDLILEVEEKSSVKTGMTLNLAMNYGGRDEITHSVRELAKLVKEGKLQPEDISEEMIGDHLYTAGQPDPDLIIRPSGEQRLSNFLLWQAAYAEFYFSDKLWPDLTPDDIDEIVENFKNRSRRFGGV